MKILQKNRKLIKKINTNKRKTDENITKKRKMGKKQYLKKWKMEKNTKKRKKRIITLQIKQNIIGMLFLIQSAS